MKIVFSKPELPASGIFVVAVMKNRKLSPSARAMDKKMKGALRQAMAQSRFTGSRSQSLDLILPAGTGLDRLVLVGVGKAAELDAKGLQGVGGRLYATLGGKGFAAARVAVDALEGCPVKPAVMAAEMALGARLRSYRFDKYRTKEKDSQKPTLRTIRFLVSGQARARALYDIQDKVADGVFFTRDLVSEPANIIYPETLANQARSLTRLGVEVEVLGEKRMQKLGMGALLGVGQGSARESKLLIMRWRGTKSKKPPITFVGKGVTFDTGGISIKPSGGMEDMKWDMGGAGAVIGLMKALAGRKARIDAVGVAGLVENMPSSTAQRPGDIVTSMSGQTIEVLNTDAEGRLVLADALYYCADRFKPRFMINLATLTGAIIVALGNERAGLFSNNDLLAKRIEAAGSEVDEPVWRFPLGDEYDRQIKSDIADMKNISGGRGAGSITAAQFLQRFVGKTPWAHLDIAGVAWSRKDRPVVPKGGSGFGVRLLDRLVSNHYEERA
jgi:leucyl aminopeptidase